MNYWTVFWLWQMATDYSDSLGLVEFALAQVYSVPKKLFHYGQFKLPIHPKLKIKIPNKFTSGGQNHFQTHLERDGLKSWGCV